LILKSKQNSFFIKGLNLLLESASKSNFWEYFNCVIKGNLIDFEIEKKKEKSFFFIKDLHLLLGSALVP